MYNATKPVQLIIEKHLWRGQNSQCKVSDLIYDIKQHIINIDGNENTKNVLDNIGKIEGKKTIDVEKLIKRASKIAYNEWINVIQIFHLIMAIAFEINHDTKEIYEYSNNEAAYVQPDLMLSAKNTTISKLIWEMPIYIRKSYTDRIANTIIANNSVIIKGNSGVGKYMLCLGLIKSIVLKQYPTLYKSNFLINPTPQQCQKRVNSQDESYTIAIIPFKYVNNVQVPISDEINNRSLTQRLKCIYIADSDSKMSTEKAKNVEDHISTTINIEPPEGIELKEIIKCNIYEIAKYVNLKYDENIIDYIVEASDRFDNSKHSQPAKALKMFTEVAYNKVNHKITSKYDIEGNLPANMDRANKVENTEISKIINNLSMYDITKETTENINISVKDIEKYITHKYNLSNEVLASMMSSNVREHLNGLKKKMLGRIYGQDEAVNEIIKSLWRRGLKVDPMTKPVSFMFIGKTGIGKSFSAKILSEYILGSESRMIRFDMSEYMEKHEVSKLIGSPPGYVGSNRRGRLTEEVSKNPYAILLFDEIEKAHRDILNIFLQILDDGILTDNQGNVVDFSKTIIIMTSNIGVDKAYLSNNRIGFSVSSKTEEEEDSERQKDIIKEEMEKEFRPEFINRLNKVIIFNSLYVKHLKMICKTRLEEIKNNALITIKYKNIDDIIAMIINIAKSDEYNLNKYSAREIKRVISDKVENMIIDKVASNEVSERGKITITANQIG